VVVQARRVRDRSLANATVAVRAYTTSEMCDVLDGSLPDDIASIRLYTLERYSLRHADCLVWPGGDVLETYRRFYGSMPLATGVRIAHPLAPQPAQPSPQPVGAADRLGRRGAIAAGARPPPPRELTP